jgi:glyceraldehyde 3-phosphate dehydrogenase
MAVRIGINGFGRIGRLFLRAVIGHPALDIVAVNDVTEPRILAHLFEFDSVHGTFKGDVSLEDTSMVVDSRGGTGPKRIRVLSERDPAKLPWESLGVDVVVESTGHFTRREDLAKHLTAGAKRVIISAPAKNPDLTVVMGVNEDWYDPTKHFIISNASCTTNGLAPVAKVLADTFGFQRGFFNTVHGYTADQRLVDSPHDDLRRSRAAALSIIPTSSGAAVAAGEVVPSLKGKMTGLALRTPNPDGSIIDLTAVLEKAPSKDEINEALRDASLQPRMRKILAVWDKEVVSADIIGTTYSGIVDAKLTMAIDNLVKVMVWYDNEFGYSTRLGDLAEYIAQRS